MKPKKKKKKKKQEQIDNKPLITPRSRSPLKKGRKQIKFHNEAKIPLGGSISHLIPHPRRSPQNNYKPISESIPIPTCNFKKTLFLDTQVTKKQSS